MEQAFIGLLSSSGPTVGLVVAGGYYMAKYFMSQIDKKDIQNQNNLDKFVILHEKTMEVIGNINPKLNDIHDDIKEIKNRK